MTGRSSDPRAAAGRPSACLPADGLAGPSPRVFPPPGTSPSPRTFPSMGAGSSPHASHATSSLARPDLRRLPRHVPASGGYRAQSQPPSAPVHRHPRPAPPPRAPPPCAASTPAAFHHWQHSMPVPHLTPTPLSRHDPTSSSSTTSPALACSSSSDATHPPSSLGWHAVLRRRQKTFPNCLPHLSSIGEPTGAGSSPPRHSSSPGQSTFSS